LHFFFQTGLSGNVIMLSVLYSGGMMMTDAQISVGDLTSFLLYAGFVGISFGGNKMLCSKDALINSHYLPLPLEVSNRRKRY